MSITDELRKWGYGFCGSSYEVVNAIADRIDAEHEAQLNDAFETRNSDENLESGGWVKLPLDADGVPIRVGDVMEFSAFEVEKPVTRMVDGIGQGVFFAWCGERGYQQHEAKRYRHHHEPTVEDVLREFLCVFMGKREFDGDAAEAISEYASRLRLAGDE